MSNHGEHGQREAETAVREWVKQAERDAGTRVDGGLTSAEREELDELRREARRLREDVEILKRAPPTPGVAARATARAIKRNQSSCSRPPRTMATVKSPPRGSRTAWGPHHGPTRRRSPRTFFHASRHAEGSAARRPAASTLPSPGPAAAHPALSRSVGRSDSRPASQQTVHCGIRTPAGSDRTQPSCGALQ